MCGIGRMFQRRLQQAADGTTAMSAVQHCDPIDAAATLTCSTMPLVVLEIG